MVLPHFSLLVVCLRAVALCCCCCQHQQQQQQQVCATPDQLLSAVQSFDASQLQPLPPGDARSVVAAIDDFMGRTSALPVSSQQPHHTKAA